MVINKKYYKDELNLIIQACKEFNGTMEISDANYEIARFHNADGDIIFYQYSSKSGHKCIRSRINKVFNR